jgi:nitroreductase
MNEILSALESRRSVRKYKSDPVPAELIDQIIEAGLYAASAKGEQKSIVLAVTNRALRDELAEMNRKIGGWPEGFDPFYGAPAVLVVLSEKGGVAPAEDGALVIGNLMQAAAALGVGSCWIHRARQEFDSDEGKAILKKLGVQGDYVGVGHCILGYAAAPAPKAAPRKSGRVFYAK